MSDYKARLLQAFQLHECWCNAPLLFPEPILIREVSARVRLQAQEAAVADDSESPDNTLYQALLILASVVDPDSGTPYPDGRIDPQTGTPLIDPRTRAPLLSADELPALIEGREILVRTLMTEITSLSVLTPDALFFRRSADDAAESDAGTDVSAGGADAPGDPPG